MNKNSKYYELEKRTFEFAKRCRDFVSKLPKTISNIEYSKQLIKSSGSQAANYIEANESLSKKDFEYRIKISRKETKESCMWLELCETGPDRNFEKERVDLINEGIELRNIFNSILGKTQNSQSTNLFS